MPIAWNRQLLEAGWKKGLGLLRENQSELAKLLVVEPSKDPDDYKIVEVRHEASRTSDYYLEGLELKTPSSPTRPFKLELCVEPNNTITRIIGYHEDGAWGSLYYHLEFRRGKFRCLEGYDYHVRRESYVAFDFEKQQYTKRPPLVYYPKWTNDVSVLFNFLLTVPPEAPCFKWLMTGQERMEAWFYGGSVS
jgi:hypothetical protein